MFQVVSWWPPYFKLVFKQLHTFDIGNNNLDKAQEECQRLRIEATDLKREISTFTQEAEKTKAKMDKQQLKWEEEKGNDYIL